jgi:hypothetical protein
MEKAFLEQAANVNVADRELMENGEKVRRLCSILISGQEKRIFFLGAQPGDSKSSFKRISCSCLTFPASSAHMFAYFFHPCLIS